jgi:hypothetical protein
MQAYRLETILTQNHTLLLDSLPFQAGEWVEVIILTKVQAPLTQNPYPLRGTPVSYVDPTEPVAENDWEILQ